MPFLALDLSLDLIRGLRPTIELLRRKSPRLRRQLEDSLAGIVQNVCEGSGRSGGDRPALYRYGLGSLREVNGILLAAVAFGWLAEDLAASGQVSQCQIRSSTRTTVAPSTTSTVMSITVQTWPSA